jgi:hypothetical protein
MLKGASPKGRGFSKFKRKFDAKVLAELRADDRSRGRVEISTDQVAPFFSVSMVRPATAQHQVGVELGVEPTTYTGQ